MNAMIKRIGNIIIQFIGGLSTNLRQIEEVELAPKQLAVIQHSPANLSLLSYSLQQYFAEAIEQPRKVIYYCPNVSVSWHGLVMKGLELFKPSLPYPEAWNEFSGTYLLRQWVKPVAQPLPSKSREIALAYDFWSVNNYYHWLVDVLPRLLLLRQSHANCILLLPEGAAEYMKLSAQAMGFTEFYFIPKNKILTNISVIMPGHVAAIGRQDTVLLRRVRQELINSFVSSQTSINSKRRIFASRRTQHTRRLLNEEDILPLLQKYNIEVVLFDGMTISQQIELMQSVELLIGVHGANMANLLFLASSASVIELIDAQHPNLCYFNMASNLSFDYRAVPCEGIVKVEVHENNYDLRVDVNYLEQIIIQSISPVI